MYLFCLLYVDVEMFIINFKKFLLYYFYVIENYKIIGVYYLLIIVYINSEFRFLSVDLELNKVC